MDGTFLVNGLRAGTYTVSAECLGASGKEVVAIEGDTRDLVVELEADRRRPSLVGRTVDSDSTPVADVPVTLKETYVVETGTVVNTTSTFSRRDGEFELYGISPGTSRLRAGWGTPVERDVVIVEGGEPTRVTIVVERELSASVAGTVTTRAGAPAQRVMVQLRGHSWKSAPLTDRDGRFDSGPMPSGEFEASLVDRFGDEIEIVSGPKKLCLEADLETRVEFQISMYDDIEGVVIDGAGAPLIDACVKPLREGAESDRFDDAERPCAFTDLEGRFRLTGLSDDVYAVRAERVGQAVGEVTGVRPGDDVTIKAKETGSISGRVVTEAGRAPTDMTLTVWSALDEHTVGGWGAERGRFAVDGLEPAMHVLYVWSNEGSARKAIELAPGADVEDVLITVAARGTIRGQIVDAETGRGIPEVIVRTWGSRPNQHGVRGKTTAEGRFALEGVPTETVVGFWFGREGYVYPPTSLFLVVESGVTIDLPTFAMERGESGDFGFEVRPWKLPSRLEELRLTVTEVEGGSPAENAGLRAGDVIVRVDGVDVRPGRGRQYGLVITSHAGRTVELTLDDGRTVRMTAR